MAYITTTLMSMRTATPPEAMKSATPGLFRCTGSRCPGSQHPDTADVADGHREILHGGDGWWPPPSPRTKVPGAPAGRHPWHSRASSSRCRERDDFRFSRNPGQAAPHGERKRSRRRRERLTNATEQRPRRWFGRALGSGEPAATARGHASGAALGSRRSAQARAVGCLRRRGTRRGLC